MMKRKNLPMAVMLALAGVMLVTAMLAAAYFVCKTYLVKPDPIPVHAIYKRANWNWKEEEVELLAYGDDVTFRTNGITYTMPSRDFIAWHVYDQVKTNRTRTKDMSFTIELPNGKLVQDVCYEPLRPDVESTNSFVIDTGVVKYYISPDRIRFD